MAHPAAVTRVWADASLSPARVSPHEVPRVSPHEVQLGAGEAAGRLAAEDPAPYRENCYPSPDIYFPGILPAYGLYVDYADGVELKNVRFRTLAEGPVELRPEIVRTGR